MSKIFSTYNEMAHSSGRIAGNVLTHCDTPQRPTAEGAPATLTDKQTLGRKLSPPSARESGTQWAGAQRPKAESRPKKHPQKPNIQDREKSTSINHVNTIKSASVIPTPHSKPTEGVYTAGNAVNINLKLRTQAKKLGLIPGSPSWRAYVLGTLSAMKKRNSACSIIAQKSFGDCVTPRTCDTGVTTPVFGRPKND